jgi:hypothetical protein
MVTMEVINSRVQMMANAPTTRFQRWMAGILWERDSEKRALQKEERSMGMVILRAWLEVFYLRIKLQSTNSVAKAPAIMCLARVSRWSALRILQAFILGFWVLCY